MRVLTPSGVEAEAASLLGRLLAGFAFACTLLGLLAQYRLITLLPLAAMLLGTAGLAGATAMALARGRVAAGGREALIGLAARRPQASVVPLLALGAAGCAWFSRGAVPTAAIPAGWVLAACAAASFALLVAERTVALAPIPEATALSRLLRVPVVVSALYGLLLAATEARLPWTGAVSAIVAAAVGGVGVELTLRGLARWFLPPPEPAHARAAVGSILLLVARRPSPSGLVAPLRENFGLDFSRSWALAYARAVVMPLILVLLVGTWLLSGVVLVPADGRAVAERFGAPVAVLNPGLHAILPWPLGRALPVEFGTVHETALTGPAPMIERVAAEAAAPSSANRLWETAHPAELPFLVASESGGLQSFQIVSADLRVLYRVGLSDEDATRSVVATSDPAALVRTAASRAVAAALARRTLADVLGAAHDTLADELRTAAQDDLDRLGSGLQIVAVAVEAIHPPPGAADAYHAVQSAEIAANTTISTERGRAQAALAMAAQQAATRLDVAQAEAAEQRMGAVGDETRFAADRQAAKAGGPAFLIERTHENLVAALAGTPKTIMDARLGAGGPTVIDLRPLLPATPAARDD